MSAPVRLPSRAGKALFIDSVAPHTRLLEKRRQMFEVEEALKAQKQEYARREDAFHQREEGLRKKDLDLQEALIRFNSILSENEAKRVRAEKRSTEEMRSTVGKEGEIREASGALDVLREEVAALNAERASLEPYMRFMETFQRAHAQEYAEVHGVTERFATLTHAHADLLGEAQKLAADVEDERRALARVRKAASTQVLTSENIVTKLKERLEEVRARVARLQLSVEEGAHTSGERALELGQILQSVLNLHTRCVTSEHGRVIRHTPADGEIPGVVVPTFGGAEADSLPEPSVAGSDDEQASTLQGVTRSDGVSSSPAASTVSLSRMEAATAAQLIRDGGVDSEGLKTRVAEATALLRVVGKYINDFDAIVHEHSAWQAEQRRKQTERDAAAAVEAGRLNAARAARTGARPATRGGSPDGAGGRAPGASGRGAAVDVSSPTTGIGATTLTQSASGLSLTQSGAVAQSSSSGGGAPSTARRAVVGVRTAAATAGAAAMLGSGNTATLAASGAPQGPLISRGGAKVYVVKGAALPAHIAASITGRHAAPSYAQPRGATAPSLASTVLAASFAGAMGATADLRASTAAHAVSALRGSTLTGARKE